MDNLRIYMAIETFLPLVGGSEMQAFAQSKYLHARGIDTTIVTMHFDQTWPECEMLDEVPVLRVARRILSLHESPFVVLRRFCYFLALLAMGHQLWKHRHDYEILHVFQLTLFTLPILIVSRLAHKPLLIGMRCDTPEIIPDCYRRKTWTDLEGLTRLGRPTIRLINRQLHRAQALILVLSPRMRESLSQAGLTGAEVCVIPNGVDTERFCPINRERKATLTVVCVAKLRYQKGIDVLLQSWCTVIKDMPAARLVIVGDGPLLVPLQNQARELGLASHVEFTGLCLDVARQLQRGSIAVLPSRWEGMPNALLEAMSSGLACVATRVSGSEDLLGQGERGLLVEPEDSAGLSRALLFLLKNPELVALYGQEARRYIEQHCSFASVMYKHIQLYHHQLAKYRN